MMPVTTRLRKEIRPLLFPWAVTMIAAVGYLGSPVSPGSQSSAQLQSLAGFAFAFGCLALATLPFGSEFQTRTFGLILSQPLERIQVWRDKVLAAILAIASTAAVHGVAYWLFASSSVYYSAAGIRTTSIGVSDLWSPALFVIATTCSAALWTLIARSTIGGAILTLAFQLFPYVFLDLFVGSVDDSVRTGLTISYSAVMLWAGWRKFSRLELRDAPATSISMPEGWLPSLSRLLRCRKQGVWRNLVRKELLLLRQLGQLSVIFIAGWLVLIVLAVLLPQRVGTLEIAFNSLNAVFSGLVVLIAGSLAASEERTLGISAWQLTLPVAARWQWLIKLITAAATAIALAYLLPRALVSITPIAVGTPVADQWLPSLVALGIIAFVTSFWLSSFGENVVQSSIATIVLLIGTSILSFNVPFAARNGAVGFQTELWLRFLSYFQLAPMALTFVEINWMLSVAVLPMLYALRQSRKQFERADIRSRLIARNVVAVLVILAANAFWLTDLVKSERLVTERLKAELSYALPLTTKVQEALLADRSPSAEVLTLTGEELARTDLISPEVEEWLRNSTVTFSISMARIISDSRSHGEALVNPWQGERIGPLLRSLKVTFPNGTITYFSP